MPIARPYGEADACSRPPCNGRGVERGCSRNISQTLLSRTSRIIWHYLPVLTVKVALRVALQFGRLGSTTPKLQALVFSPALDPRAVDREMVVRQKRLDP